MNKKPVYYMQTDPRWAKKPYRVPGENTTISHSGCGPSCAAMLIETLTGKTFTPEDACAWSVQHGYKALHQGTYYSYFTPQFSAFGIECQMLNWEKSYGKPDHPNHQKAVDMLKQGYYIIALMGPGLWTTSGHFVVVWWADDKIRINDPASKKTARLEGDPKTFWSQATYYWWVDAREYNMEPDQNGPSEEENEVRVNTLDEIRQSFSYALPTVEKLINNGFLQGGGKKDENGFPADMDLSADMLRVLTLCDRAGAFDK